MFSERVSFAFVLGLMLIISKVFCQPMKGAFIAEVKGKCTGPCRKAIRDSLSLDSATSGCRPTRASMIGDLSFVNIICPPSPSMSEAVVNSALRVGSIPGNVNINLVKQDFMVTTTTSTTNLWGIDEADGGVTREHGNIVRDGLRTCNTSSKNGAGVNVWVLDTGCNPTPGGFCEGYYGGSPICKDNQGHGTHVAGIVNSPLYGVAPSAVRSCVKVLSDNGSGSYSNVIRGIEFAVNNRGAFANGDVINLSLSGPRFEPVNEAISEARKLGVYFTIAAGNDAANACNYSPASTPGGGIFTVQAHDINLDPASFTNYATSDMKCTKLSAPGVSILSDGLRPGSTRILSGTSMASPHVAGALAILLSDGKRPNRKLLATNSEVITIPGALNRRTVGLACT